MLLYNIESMAEQLSSTYQKITSHIEHMGLRGASREDALKDCLGKLLPRKYAVGCGTVVDVEGTQSKQQDFFVYDAFSSPIFLQTESSVVIPAESVYATVEIKSSLCKQALREGVENIQSVKTLELHAAHRSADAPDTCCDVFGGIFSYASETSLKCLAHNLEEVCRNIPRREQPSVVCVLDRGLIVNISKQEPRSITSIPSEMSTWAIVENDKTTNLYLFYLVLQQHLNESESHPPDLLEYAAASNILDNITVMIPNDMIPDDLSIGVGDSRITGGDMKFLGENQQQLYRLLSSMADGDEENIESLDMPQEEIDALLTRFGSIFRRFSGQDQECDNQGDGCGSGKES